MATATVKAPAETPQKRAPTVRTPGTSKGGKRRPANEEPPLPARLWVYEFVRVPPATVARLTAVDAAVGAAFAEAQRAIQHAYQRRLISGDYWRWRRMAVDHLTMLDVLLGTEGREA